MDSDVINISDILNIKHAKEKNSVKMMTDLNQFPFSSCLKYFNANKSVFNEIIDGFCLCMSKISTEELSECSMYLDTCFRNIDCELIRKCVFPLVGSEICQHLSKNRLDFEMSQSDEFKAMYEQIISNKKDKNNKKDFIPVLLNKYFEILEKDDSDKNDILYTERVISLFISLLNEKTTRGFILLLLEDNHFYVRSKNSQIYRNNKDELFNELLDYYRKCERLEPFESSYLQDEDNEDDEEEEISINRSYYDEMIILQKVVFKYYDEKLKELSLNSIYNVSSPKTLLSYFNRLSDDELCNLCIKLRIIPDIMNNDNNISKCIYSRQLMLDILLDKYSKSENEIDSIDSIPLLPNEKLIWNDKILLSKDKMNDINKDIYCLPKLNLEFLSFNDYLLRNFQLFRLESYYEIRQDLVENIKRMNSRLLPDGKTEFRGFSKYALPIKSFKILEVKKPKLGELKPSRVTGELKLDYSILGGTIKDEWENIKEHEILFLVTIKSPYKLVTYIEKEMNNNMEEEDDDNEPNRSLWNIETNEFLKKEGIISVRGCEVSEMLDENNNVLNEMNKERVGMKRLLHVTLDTNQYQMDIDNNMKSLYNDFNLVIRRKPEKNNFKAVLKTILDLLKITSPTKYVPKWLQSLFLGNINSNSQKYRYINMKDKILSFDYLDTFLSKQHLIQSNLGKTIKFISEEDGKEITDEALIKPPFKVKYSNDFNTMEVTPYTITYQPPYTPSIIRKNTVIFNHSQIEGITSGMNNGLTMIVGPPGTGKTDVAVQIISNIYHNFPEQRTLLITHSNNALNDLFSKIMERDIDERHLVRLGLREKELETNKNFSKYGRVDYTLLRRIELLKEVNRLCGTLDVYSEGDHTCESAEYYYISTVKPRIDLFHRKVEDIRYKINGNLISEEERNKSIEQIYPFLKFFENATQRLITHNFDADLIRCENGIKYIEDIFKELKEYRIFELLRSNKQRGDYLLIKQAKIIALTCTHAALIREKLIEIGFKYDNIIMEESAQILEIESFIPMLLQNEEIVEKNKLKRIVLIGDHNQLPPIIQNQIIQQYCHFDQSLFTRFVRLGVPLIQLNNQGRARSTIADLYRWKYDSLGDLPHINENIEFQRCNGGFLYDYQFINVDGEETQLSPWVYQNQNEADYIVAVYQYMRLTGYPANKISIITTYNGQKQLLYKLFKEKCSQYPQFGMPYRIITVDKYQGQQNDYILLSLVRTKSIGHIRDDRRLIVALSRARLGLFILGKYDLYSKCEDFNQVFGLLNKRPLNMVLVKNERFGSDRKVNDEKAEKIEIKNLSEMTSYVQTINKK